MAAYEVQTDDLIGVGEQLGRQAGVTATTRIGVDAATTSMITVLDTGASTAEATVGGLLADLAVIVSVADAAAGGADWLGADAEVFRSANAELVTVIGRSQTGLEQAFVAHRTATGELGRTLQATLTEFVAASSRSEDLAAQLAAAVGSEVEAYEAAFAGGFSGVGGFTGEGSVSSSASPPDLPAAARGSVQAESDGVDDLAAAAVRALGDGVYDSYADLGSGFGDALRLEGDWVGGGVENLGELVGSEDVQHAGLAIDQQFDAAGDAAQDGYLAGGSTVRNGLHNAAAGIDGDRPPVEVRVYRNRTPESAQHIQDAQGGTSYRGGPETAYDRTQGEVFTIDRSGARARRHESTGPVPTAAGYDRDEYPPAVFAEGGAGASVRYIRPGDNRSAGAQIGNQIRGLPDTEQPVRVVVVEE